ncbi:MAG TPA: phosphoribosylanthranilate isomerase [bacterium]|nr:phosphoribosylanthranilate isomerase [bacterium]
MLVKICGITNLEDALAAVEFGADALGFNFYAKSPRHVSPEKVEKILEEIPPSILRVGVFVNETEQVVRDLSVALELNYLQFHGDETPSYCEQFAVPYWKAFRLKDEKTLELMKKYKCDYYLVDTFLTQAYGGTGVTGNWDLAREAKKMGKIILAGGLTPENVADAIRTVKPDGVDVASGVEEKPGRKDAAKVERFISNVRESGL